MTKAICPGCGEVVTELAVEHGGVAIDAQESRWHYSCWMKDLKPLEELKS